ncbi:MAG: endolytic transglycosylase MltG, partial [Pedobacter sp.]|nr:endolytic transglycosylase MltG [Pedobacter sp.]
MTTENTTSKKKPTTKIVLIILLVLLIGGGFYGFSLYKLFFSPNITGKEKYLYIKTGGTMDDLMREIKTKDLLKDEGSFVEAAAKMDLVNQRLKPGRYKLTKNMNNRTLINTIKSGNQDPVKLKFQNIRKKENFAGYLSKSLEADSLSFLKVLDSAALVEKYGFTTDNIYTMFVP